MDFTSNRINNLNCIRQMNKHWTGSLLWFSWAVTVGEISGLNSSVQDRDWFHLNRAGGLDSYNSFLT